MNDSTALTSSFVRDQQRYALSQLSNIFDCSLDETVHIVRKLKEFGILKTVSATDSQKELSELTDDDITITEVNADSDDSFFVFTFVGVAVVARHVLKCYPKYIKNIKNPFNELRQILKVLEKYNSRNQIIRMFNENSENSSFNLLAVQLFLINDYYENGIYSNTEDIVEINGSGEILWDKTINETFALISDDTPYYTGLLTKKRTNNESDYFKRLHECILTRISQEMKNADLLDLLEITEIDLTDQELDDFGETEYILYRIEQELNTQFNTRKQLVLKTIHSYISNGGSLNDINSTSLFGTTSFNLVWEDVCSDILNNQLHTPIAVLATPLKPVNHFYVSKKLLDIIEKPQWTITGKEADKTLIPDLITISGDQFLIFDAKYYTPVLSPGKKPQGQPGIESVTKQYLYQQAYRQFIIDHGLKQVKNSFLMPTEKSVVENMGSVRMNMFASMGLQDINVRYIPASRAYELYLSGNKFDINELQL
jgi:hypothetical protein